MLEIAKVLSKDIPFLRVDLYEINGKIYFGELTFTPCAGMMLESDRNSHPKTSRINQSESDRNSQS